MPRHEIHDVVQIGFGPVGKAMAALLGRAGLRVAVVERWPRERAHTRDGHLDREIWRILQSVGVTEESEDAQFRALDAVVRELPSVSVYCGWEAIALRRHTDHVEVRLRSAYLDVFGRRVLGDDERTVRARYLVGADGADSFVRRHIDCGRTDFGFRETWLVADVETADKAIAALGLPQPEGLSRPHCSFRTGENHRRFQFALAPGESREEADQPDAVWRLLNAGGVTTANTTLIRHSTSTFHAEITDRWSDGRVFLVGDAAHRLPPFTGQGLASGLRDAKALAWRLALAARGIGGPAVLESYQRERAQHVATLIQLSMTAEQFARDIGSFVAAPGSRLDAWKPFAHSAFPAPPPFPHLCGDLLADCMRGDIVGTLAPQGRISVDGATARFDDVFGSGWILLTAPGVHAGLDARRTAVLEHLGGTFVALSPPGSGGEVIDIDDHYAGYFDHTGSVAILYRPDFYVFAAATTAAAIPTLVDDLDRKLGTIVPAQLTR